MALGTKLNKDLPVNLKLNNLIALIIFLHLSTSLANPECPNQEVALVFSNGMFNSIEDADSSRDKLKKKYGDTFINYQIAYNQNEFFIEQLLQVYEQKKSSMDHFVWSYLSQLSGPDWFKSYLQLMLKNINAKNYIIDSDLRSHISLYQSILNKNLAISIISHSQGNFYTNQSYDYLKENLNLEVEEKVRIISIANPDSRVADGAGEYCTLTSDGVINVIPFALPPNTENLNAGLFDHQFIKHYLEGSRSGPKIEQMIKSSVPQSSDLNSLGSDYNKPGFLHKSLVPMKNWLQKTENQPIQKLDLKRCLAISLFLKMENYFGESCEFRSFDTVKKISEECFNNEWSQDSGTLQYRCGLVGLSSEGSISRTGLNEERILGLHHPECFWEPQKVHTLLSRQLLNEALEFIKSPIKLQ